MLPALLILAVSLLPAPVDQVLVVTTPSWASTAGEARLFEENRLVWGPERVFIGWKGMGWGRGERPAAPRPGPIKREGDGRSPAGLFRIGPTWTRFWARRSVCVDDPRSAAYGQILTLAKGQKSTWASAEQMEMYRVAIVVTHNQQNRRGEGSCIFLHDGAEPTVGCTAMAPAALDRLRGRLRLGAQIVQLPRVVYAELRSAWKLPRLER